MKKKCYVNFLACEKRKLDTQRILTYLEKNGYTFSQKIEDADIIVFVTCAFCKKYEDWSITKMERIYRRKKKDCLFVVGGCLTSINPDRLKNYRDIILIQTRELEKLDELIGASLSIKEIKDPNITVFEGPGYNRYKSERLKTPAQNEYEKAKRGYKIRIGWGCLGNCAYCVTRYAEKELMSKPIETVLDEFQKGLEAKYSSFFFTGGDTGAYGQDIGSSIAELLTRILSVSGDYKIHFHDFGVHWLQRYSAQIIPVLESQNTKLGCFNLPIQSGSDRILQMMHRLYRIDDVISLICELKGKAPQMKIGTHFIVGFPGETEEDFEKSVQLVKKVRFDFLNVFQYTDHELATSHSYPDKLPDHIILQRYNILFNAFEETFLEVASKP